MFLFHKLQIKLQMLFTAHFVFPFLKETKLFRQKQQLRYEICVFIPSVQ